MDNPAKSRRRGEPLVVLAAVLIGWAGLRAAIWEPPFSAQASSPVLAPNVERSSPSASEPDLAIDPSQAIGHARLTTRTIPVAWETRFAGDRALSLPRYVAPERDDVGPGPASALPAVSVASHGNPSFPPPLQRVPAQLASPYSPPELQARRWRIDGWALWRPGGSSGGLSPGATGASAYGGSQGGAQARLDLGAGPRKPAAIVRVVHAPGRFAQSDASVGISLRPVGTIPVRLHGEARLTHGSGRTELRPTGFAVSDWAPIDLPFGVRLESYAQAGWVGGRDATGFIDGQARLDRKLAQVGPAELRVGAGAWGGAQDGANRADLGPSVTFDFREAGAPIRLSVDYRIGVAGNARPGDGPAVTLSTGF